MPLLDPECPRMPLECPLNALGFFYRNCSVDLLFGLSSYGLLVSFRDYLKLRMASSADRMPPELYWFGKRNATLAVTSKLVIRSRSRYLQECLRVF